MLVHVPFSWRLGRTYLRSKDNIRAFGFLTKNKQRDFILKCMQHIVQFAYHNNNFYHDYYQNNGFYPDQLKAFDDIERIPIVTKADLRQYDIERRSTPQRGRLRINTGGTSGEPLEFYVDAQAFAREWAYMHHIWSQVGYVQQDLKLTFRGRNLGNRPLKYNPVHNEYIVNTYLDPDIVGKAIREVLERRCIKFLHGYPSAVYNFACYCANSDPFLADELRRSLKGILLGSEYPAPVYRNLIDSTFRAPTISWYGHSEMAILASEWEEKYIYFPFHTYGYCEVVPADGSSYRLIGTSYDNVASPFIRYDTGDLVIPQSRETVLEAFRVEAGRVGDFILDAHGNRISLTSLIFGRHHRIFGIAHHVQVSQEKSGSAVIMVTLPPEVNAENLDWSEEFDISNVAVDFTFEVLSNPVRSNSGKVPLLVPSSMIT